MPQWFPFTLPLPLDSYYPIIFDQIHLLPEFLEILRTNSHRLDGLLDIYVSGPNTKTHSYALLMKQANLPLETPIAGFSVAYVLPLMGITSSDLAYKGMGKRIKESISSAASLFGVKLITVETSVGASKPFTSYNDYLEWWDLIVKEIQPKLMKGAT